MTHELNTFLIMLQQIRQLVLDADGRYATDAELSFFSDYLKTARLRFTLYQKIQKLEPQLVQQTIERFKLTRPDLLRAKGYDRTAKCARDITLILRNTAAALLSDDIEILQDGTFVWFQVMMRSLKTQDAFDVGNRIIQTVVKQTLTPEEAALFCPLLETARLVVGEAI
ncbi:MAG: phycobilisome protein [Cyanobacteria bacterium J06638_28]